jgi:SAM-dependent methyltransferase
MSNLYKELSAVYEAMYQTFINYGEEYEFYSSLLIKYHCTHILEIGCGTGHLAAKFTGNNFNYTGIDLSEDMLSLAKTNNPGVNFFKADMREFSLSQKINAAIITGRTISYVTSNEDVQRTFSSIHKNLVAGGIVCFDFIDANRFIPPLKNGKKISHYAKWDNKSYRRDSYWEINYSQSWTFNWHSVYFEETDNGSIIIGEDRSTIRSFTKDEIELFLTLAGFTIKEIIERPSYAFDTYVILAQKQ